MPEPQTTFSNCPLCGGNAYEPAVVTRTDGTISEGWFKCAKCKRYSVSLRPAKEHIPMYRKPYR